MALTLRRRQPAFTPADRDALVDELLAERFPLPEPTLSELHAMFVAAVRERDRLRGFARRAADELDRLDASLAAAIKRMPDEAPWLRADYDRLRAPHRARLAEVDAQLADLAATVDWPAIEAGEKAFQAAVAEALRQHDATRRRVREDAVAAADKAHADARAAVDESAPWGPLQEALRAVADLEVRAIIARRALAEVDATTGKRGRR
jgi:hypothetical protein